MDKEPEKTTPESDTDCVETRLNELRAYIKKMEQENDELYNSLGISHHQVQNHLNNKENFTKEVYDFIQRERAALEAVLDRRIEEAHASIKAESMPDDQPVGGHWIFVR